MNTQILNNSDFIGDWKLTEWFGNPSLSLAAYMKKIRSVKIWVWDSNSKNGFNFTVNAGANSAIGVIQVSLTLRILKTL